MNDLRRQQLQAALASRILILDGAMGTMLRAHNPTPADYGGPGLENCNENLCRTHPEWILEVHRAYLDAGADLLLIETGFDTRNVKAALLAIQRLEQEGKARIQVMVSGTIERWGCRAAGHH